MSNAAVLQPEMDATTPPPADTALAEPEQKPQRRLLGRRSD